MQTDLHVSWDHLSKVVFLFFFFLSLFIFYSCLCGFFKYLKVFFSMSTTGRATAKLSDAFVCVSFRK